MISFTEMADTSNAQEAVDDDVWAFTAPKSKKTKKPTIAGFDFGIPSADEAAKAQPEPQTADKDPWAAFFPKKDKKTSTDLTGPASQDAEPPAIKSSGKGTWGDSWPATKLYFNEPAPAATEATDKSNGTINVTAETVKQGSEEDDWPAFTAKPKKKKKGKKTETVPDPWDFSTRPVEKPNVDGQSSVKLDSISASADEPGHGAVGSCTCERCLDDARRKVEEQLKEPSWTSNYISKLQARITHLEVQNERTSTFTRPGRRYSSDESSIAAYSNDDEHQLVHYPRHVSPSRRVNIADEPKDPIGEDDGLKVDIKRRRKVPQRYGELKIELDDDPGNFGNQTSSNDYVLTVYREFDEKKHFWRRSVEIVSPSFMQVLRKESPYDIELRLTDDRLILHEPLMTLFHNRKTLNKYIEKGGYASDGDEVKEARSHVKLVLDFMRKELAESKVLDDIESAEPSSSIEFPNIWMLYPPGTTVYTKENGEYEALIVDSVRGVYKSIRHKSGKRSYSRLELTCWSINYDGEIFGRVWSTHGIFPFKGSKEISSLQLIPEKFLPDAEKVKSSLRSRGKEFWSLQGQNYREYHGEVWSQHMSEDAIRVMVDHLTYQRGENWPISINNKQGPAEAQSKNWRENRFGSSYIVPRPPVYDDYPRGRSGRRPPPPPIEYDDERAYSPDRGCEQDEGYEGQYQRYPCNRRPQRADSKFKQYDIIKPDSQPDDLALLLCPQAVHGYCLRDKVWKSFNVNQLKPVQFRKNAWDRLVLDPEYKDIVQAMVASYVDKTAGLDDLVAGKGAGLVALLHGPPGTGKTLTAECVADSFEKPLYQVTCGDIGTSPAHLESRLEEIFDYAVTWGAILLLDEADVFLQERDYWNLQRNALVSSKSPQVFIPAQDHAC